MHQDQTTLAFSPLSVSDAKKLLQVYLGKYWQATGRSEEQKALEYLSTALGGFPVALNQIGLYVHKKNVSFERLAEQFKRLEIRKKMYPPKNRTLFRGLT